MTIPQATRYAVEARPLIPGGKYRRIGIDGKGRIRWWSLREQDASIRNFDFAELQKVRRWAKLKARRTRVHPVRRWANLVGDLDCNVELLNRLNRVGGRLGKEIRVRSGGRTLAEQTALFERNMIAPGRPKPGRPLTAVPNANAPHIRKVAADCGIDGLDIGDFPGAIAALKREGLGLPVASEDWHVEITTSMAGARS